MKIINPKLLKDLNTYKLNFPTDARTKEYKAQIERFKAPELYKLFLQSQVELSKIKQRDIDRKAKKEANKKARAEAKQGNKVNRYIGSIFLNIKVLEKVEKKDDIKYLRNLLGISNLLDNERTDQEISRIKDILQNTEYDICDSSYTNDDRVIGYVGKIFYIERNVLVDNTIKIKDLSNTLNDMVNEEVLNILDRSPVIALKIIRRNDNIQIANIKIKPLEKIRMRQSGVGIYDGYDKQEWDTNTGRCVFDYIIYRYGNINGFKKICNYESLCEIFYDTDDEGVNECAELLKIGVNTIEIRKFCERFNIPMYAVDEIENTFNQYIPKNRNKMCPAMIYRLSNKHFYPINDNDKIKSIVKITSMINNVNSDIIQAYKPEKKKQAEADKEADEADEADGADDMIFVDDINAELLEMLKVGKIPVILNLREKRLVSFQINKIKYIFNKDIDKIKELCVNMKIDYKGQGIGTMLIDIIKEALKIEELPKSCPNHYVYNTLLTARKGRARIGIIDDEYFKYNKKDLMAWDIIKCYSSCMYKPSEGWIRYDYNDTWEDYNGLIRPSGIPDLRGLKLGLYYVKTDDTTLFKKSGYYSTAIIKKAIIENIHFEITKQLIPSHKENKDIFTKIIDVVLKYSKGNTSISKTIINLMSGMLGQSSTTTSKNIKINNDLEQIFNFLNKYHELEEGIMINKIEGTDYYMYGFNKEVSFNETNIPMYIQILDESNIKLYDMAKAMGGKLVAHKVDCAVVKVININGKRCERIDDTEWGGYTSCGIPYIANYEIINDIDFISDKDWNDNRHLKLNDSDKWEDIHKLLNRNKGLLLQASAGNGKTYTAKMIASKLGDRVKIIAPTNKAALNIGGSTIHRFLEIDKQGYIKPNKIEFINKQFDYIIVDEISMIGKDLWKRLCLVKQQLPHIIFLLLGDDKQIPPVEDEQTIKDYFNHPAVKYLCNYNKNILNVRKRYDETLYNLLEEVDKINVSDITKYPELITDRNICYYNKTRIRINKMWNDKNKKEGDLFLSKPIAKSKDEDKYINLTQDMYIYENMPVIAMRTLFDKEEGLLFANSETFNINFIGDEAIGIYNERPDETGQIEPYYLHVPIEDFNKYFLMNYCSTTHKTQGETITENFTIYDWDAMDTKLRYTALSRAKKIEQVYIRN